MPRPLERACLNDGLKLDINDLARRGQIQRGGIGVTQLRWTHSYWGEIASASIDYDMASPTFGSFHIMIGGQLQRVRLQCRPRRFGGGQWYFVCPIENRLVSVLWRPNGASRFASRQAFGRRVAYRSQFLNRDSRAHAMQAKIKDRLCQIGGENPDEWDFPPRPKWMRNRMYERYESRFDHYDDVLDSGIMELAKRFGMPVLKSQ